MGSILTIDVGCRLSDPSLDDSPKLDCSRRKQIVCCWLRPYALEGRTHNGTSVGRIFVQLRPLTCTEARVRQTLESTASPPFGNLLSCSERNSRMRCGFPRHAGVLLWRVPLALASHFPVR